MGKFTFWMLDAAVLVRPIQEINGIVPEALVE
jgi:hypothetical protein